MKRIALLAAVVVVSAVVGYLQVMNTPAKDKEKASKNPVVIIDTSMGKIEVELYPGKAPITVKNFLSYVDDKFYDGTIFHRVMGKENTEKQKDFMIQGGGFKPGMKEKKDTKDPIKLESGKGLSNVRGTIAMARTMDPDSATAQFFINVVDNKFLDKSDDSDGYAVFGKVTKGMDVVDKIKAVETGNRGGHESVPVKDIIIKSIRRAPAKQAKE
jgi:cyclophilin family peptidyl-prolyl cis-trans isomerase